MNDSNIPVVAVCENICRVYDKLRKGDTSRKLMKVISFPHYGAARLYAQDYEDRARFLLSRSQE